MASDLCDVMPPRDILDVLHEAEVAGVKIPEVVDDWWFRQTCVDQEKREQDRSSGAA